MRTEIYNYNNFQVCIRTDKTKNLITLHFLDLRLPAGTEVEIEETASYGLTPMYYADDCCMASAVYMAQIIQKTLSVNYPNYVFDCRLYTAYTMLVNPDAKRYHTAHGIRIQSGVVPADWHRCHAEQFSMLYRCADRAIASLMHDLMDGSFDAHNKYADYYVPYDIELDYDQAEGRHQKSLDAIMMRMAKLSDPQTVLPLYELDNMVGLAEYKAYIHQLVCGKELNQLRVLMGLHSETGLHGHFIFTGNPGTGKKTAAKVLGKAMCNACMLRSSDVCYRDGETLIDEDEHITEMLVDALFEEHGANKVIMIHEPYNLMGSASGRYALELLTLYTHDTDANYIVVLSGEQEQMNKLLLKYPALSDHCQHRFHFRDYKHAELMAVTRQRLADMDYHFTPEAEAAYAYLLDEMLAVRKSNFDNVLWVKTFIHEHILPALHHRLAERFRQGSVQLSRELLTVIEREDVMKGRNLY